MKPNHSHGHVTPNADGSRTRCGGPTICKVCMAELAQLRAKSAPAEVAQGEAVEVVAYIDDGGALYTSKLLEIMSVESDGCEPLMTVAQHNRIMSDVRANRDAVLKVMQARKLLPKCAPSPDAELVELLRAKFPRIDPCAPVPLDEKAHCCEYTIYVERERLHRMIDAKLASREVKP